jgi:hypothetical protein
MKPEDFKIGEIYQLDTNKLEQEFSNFQVYFIFEKIINDCLFRFKPVGGIVDGKKLTKKELEEKIDFTIAADKLFIFKEYEKPIHNIQDLYEK